MRPTKPLADASPPSPPRPFGSLALVAAFLFASIAVSHPVWTAGAVGVLVAAYLLRRVPHIFTDGHLCVPRTDVCIRLAPQ